MNREEGFNRIKTRISIDSNGCHNRTGALNNSGYGVMKIDKKFWYTHRFIFDYIKGIPEGLTVDHTCKNKLCCNIDHLGLMTLKEASLQGGISNAINNTKHFCELHNIDRHITKGGTIVCLLCQRIRSNRCYQKNKK